MFAGRSTCVYTMAYERVVIDVSLLLEDGRNFRGEVPARDIRRWLE